MTEPVDNDPDSNDEDARTKGKSGKGGRASGSTGGGAAAGTVGGLYFALNATKLKQVVSEFKKLDMSEAIARVADFFSELPARASANLNVRFDNTTQGAYAIVTKFIVFGQDMATAMRERTRERAGMIRKKYGIEIKIRKNGVAFTGPNPTIG